MTRQTSKLESTGECVWQPKAANQSLPARKGKWLMSKEEGYALQMRQVLCSEHWLLPCAILCLLCVEYGVSQIHWQNETGFVVHLRGPDSCCASFKICCVAIPHRWFLTNAAGVCAIQHDDGKCASTGSCTLSA